MASKAKKGGGGGGGAKAAGGAGGAGRIYVTLLRPLPDADDDTALLDALAARAGRCAVAGYKRPTTATGVTCGFCKERLCLEHAQAEAHGCGAAASAAARAGWVAGGSGEAFGGAPPPKPRRRGRSTPSRESSRAGWRGEGSREGETNRMLL